MTGNVRQEEELMKIGYVRVSKQEQHEALQIDALKEAGCEKWFLDKMTGSKAEGSNYTIPCLIAYATAAALPGTSNFIKILLRWRLTVLGLRTRISATS